MSSIGRARLVFVLVSISILFLLICGLIFILVACIFGSEGKTSRQTFEYSTTRLNPITKERFRGFSTIYEEIKPYEFLSYETSSGDLVLMSNGDQNEYLCKATCLCGDDRRSGVSSSFPSRVVFYLVAATTSYLAVRIAEKHLYHRCEEVMKEEECSAVEIEFDECEIDSLIDSFDYIREDEGIAPTMENINGNYICKGYCIVNPEYLENERVIHAVRNRKKETLQTYCEGIDQGALFEFNPWEMKVHESQIWKMEEKKEPPSELAKIYYAAGLLDPFCRENSKLRISTEDENIEVCMGWKQVDGVNFIHQKTQCKKVYKTDPSEQPPESEEKPENEEQKEEKRE